MSEFFTLSFFPFLKKDKEKNRRENQAYFRSFCRNISNKLYADDAKGGSRLRAFCISNELRNEH